MRSATGPEARSLVTRRAQPLHRCDELLAEVLAEREQPATRGRVGQPCGTGEKPESTVAGGFDSEVARRERALASAVTDYVHRVSGVSASLERVRGCAYVDHFGDIASARG